MLRIDGIARPCFRMVAGVVLVVLVGSGLAGAASLPDNRAYELASPPAKNGGDVMAQGTRTRAAIDGNAVAFTSLSAFGDAHGTGIAAEYVSKRDGIPNTNGWSSHATIPKVDPLSLDAALSSMDTFFMGEMAPDLSKGILRTFTNLSGDPNLAQLTGLYIRNDLLVPGPGSFDLVTSCPLCVSPLPATGSNLNATVDDSTPDFGHVIFEWKYQLTSDAPANNTQVKLYEWDHGTVRYVGILPASEGGGTAPRSASGRNSQAGSYTPNTISDDGSKIFFTVASSNTGTRGQLYMRVDHTSTVRINASERTDCAGDPNCGGDGLPDPAPDPNDTQMATYGTATPDGSKVFFTTDDGLTDDDDDGITDVYVYDTTLPASDPHNLTRLSPDDYLADGSGGGLNLIGTSTDGDYVYFLGGGQLAASGETVSTTAIYVWHDGVVRYVGGLPGAGDNKRNIIETSFGTGRQAARVTPDGTHLLFAATDGSELTGYDHNTTGCGPSFNEPCSELYLYSAESDTLVCASCNPSGEQATSDASADIGTGLGGSRFTSHLNHPLSDDGSRVFFTTGEALVPGDRNGRKLDVYEYDSTSGQLHLLSSGRSADDSYFLDAGANGRDVFFATRERLNGWDVDNSYDLYDARVGGGFPEPAPQPPLCVGDACQGPVTSAPAATAPLSSTFAAGNDNVKRTTKHKAKRCKRGKVLKKVHGKRRCVKKKSKATHAANATATRRTR